MSVSDNSKRLSDIIENTRMIPIMAIENPDHAIPLAHALVDGGLRVMEVLLRSKAALESVHRITKSVPEARVGVGTILESYQLEQAKEAGAKFAVSPAAYPELIETARYQSLPWLPGAVTPTEILTLFSKGFTLLKFFPAESFSPSYLHDMQGPYPLVRFCTTSMFINEDNAGRWLQLSNVACVGGGWVTPATLIHNQDWAGIENLAREAAKL